jgi:hypothetical protein
LTWSIPINDPNGNVFNWNIACSNGQSSSAVGASNGTKSLSISGLVPFTIYKVYVNATDPAGSGQWTRRWYQFTTLANQPPTFGTPSPINGSTGQQSSLVWSIPITDAEGNVFRWYINCSNGQYSTATGASNGTKTLSISGLSFSTNYTVWVNATDVGSGTWTRRYFTFVTRAASASLSVSPTTYSFGPMRLDEEKTSTVLTFTNNGESTLTIVNISVGNITGGLVVWNVSLVAGNDTYAFDFYNGTAWINITDLPTTVLTSLVVSGSKSCRIRVHTPVNSSQERNVKVSGIMSIKYIDGQTKWLNYTFDIHKIPTITTTTLGTLETSGLTFIPGGIFSSDLFYLSIPANMSKDTKIDLPSSYSKKSWVFWRADTTINSVKVFGIAHNWELVPLTYEGSVQKGITLDINDIDDWSAFIIVPNPGYFQNSDWWFGLLNNAQGLFVEGESLA